jgi:Cys-tRNA(Pro)/Cys-tRNA(Cys) deacylase
MGYSIKNNVTRLLDQKKVNYTVYELPVEKLGAEVTAKMLGVPPEIVFKTIVIKREGRGKPILAVVPGDREVDLKKLAAAVGEKKVFLTTQKEAEKLTKLQVGGISPLALISRGFQVVIDQSAQTHHAIHVSGGQRGMNIRLPVVDLQTLTNARLAEISRSR